MLGVANSTRPRGRKGGWLQARWHPQGQRWVAWVDEAELERLKQRCALPAGAENRKMWIDAYTSHPAASLQMTNVKRIRGDG